MVYNDGFYWHGDNRLRQPSYTLLNGSVTMDLVDGKYQVRVWGKNLGNAKYYISEAEIQGRGDWEMRAPPRTYGLTFLAHFNSTAAQGRRLVSTRFAADRPDTT